MNFSLKESEVAWLAGLLEGEGCFGVRKCFYKSPRGKRIIYEYPFIALGMTDCDVVNRVAEFFGTSVIVQFKKPPNKTMFRAALYGSKSTELMRIILPWMGERRRGKILEILVEHEGKISKGDVARRRIISAIESFGKDGAAVPDLIRVLEFSEGHVHTLVRELIKSGDLRSEMETSVLKRPIRRLHLPTTL